MKGLERIMEDLIPTNRKLQRGEGLTAIGGLSVNATVEVISFVVKL
jgi:hypothetical protein